MDEKPEIKAEDELSEEQLSDVSGGFAKPMSAKAPAHVAPASAGSASHLTPASTGSHLPHHAESIKKGH